MRTHFLKTRLSPAENRALNSAADVAGLTVSEYVRTVLARDREAISVEAQMSKLDAKLRTLGELTMRTCQPALPTDAMLLLVEVLLLTREIAADRNVQILSRVALAMDNKFGKDRERT